MITSRYKGRYWMLLICEVNEHNFKQITYSLIVLKLSEWKCNIV